MLDTTKNALRALLPDANDTEIQDAAERFTRYLHLVIEIVQTAEGNHSEKTLTHPNSGVNVNPGKVDPRTFTNTG